MSSLATSSTIRSLNSLARAMAYMSHRVPTDDDAKNFKMNQLRKSITGTPATQRPIERHHRDGHITGLLLDMSAADDSHLALKRPAVIGCHSHRVLAQKDISALDLHYEQKHCRQCATDHPSRISDIPMNPFSCWRRGHRSGNFGFLLNQSIQPTQHNTAGWALDPNPQILTSSRLQLALQHLRFGGDAKMFPNGSPLHMGRAMVVVATVRWNIEASDETNKSITRVLDAQYLHSISKQHEVDRQELDGEREKLYEFLKQHTTEVKGFWKGSAGLSQRNNLGVLSIAVVYCSAKEELDFLSGALNESAQQSIDFIPFDRLNPAQRQQLGLDNARFKPQGDEFAICLFLDPIVDLVMHHD
jgi:hypothetical protein